MFDLFFNLEPALFIFLIVFVVGFFFFIYHQKWDQRRTQELIAFAQQEGFVYIPPSSSPGCSLSLSPHVNDNSLRLLTRLEGFYPFGEGSNNKIGHTLTGQFEGLQWYLFEYSYEIKSGKNTTTYHFSIVACELPKLFLPYLHIRPENFGDKLGAMVGFRDVQFESEEFNKHYHVKSKDKKFAFDILHPAAMQYLLSQNPEDIQLGGNYALCVAQNYLEVHPMRMRMLHLSRFIQTIPDYVEHDYQIVQNG